ncbi:MULTISPECIES: dipeptide epimerase [Caproicibacterium]|uniref:Dipeptide epimerase n=1 Tax=Caproicibacterium argilliputei TaxID=3030016 RepID=A0AA97D8H4_9FIRM|nr:dipeptide epimerase [Caproicibacterium argilliputei]WOC32510.1 dipeptide epimerase [Caproicibacterium argilliputei]
MKIASIHTSEFRVGLRTPFKTALRTVREIHDVLVTVTTTDGRRGYGEAPPTAPITGETIGSIRCAVEEFIQPALVGREIEDLEDTMHALHTAILHNTSAKAAVDMAIYDLYARSLGVPLYRLLGGNKKELETDLTVSVNSPEEMAADSLAAVRRGFRILKIKVGLQPELDLARIRAVREAVGSQIAIRVDANQGWSPAQAVRIIRGMEDAGLNLDFVEQPVKAADLDGMAYVRQNVSTPILADESVFSAADAMAVLQKGAADLLNIKLMKTGGIYGALQICSIAESCGVSCMIGCMLESSLAVSAAAHLAAGKRVIACADLDGPGLCKENPYHGGPQFLENRIVMNENPGLGISPKWVDETEEMR